MNRKSLYSVSDSASTDCVPVDIQGSGTVTYFHGTEMCYAHSIMTHGFSLGREHWGRGWGNGVYLSGTEAFASTWGQIIIACKLRAGARILWHTDYDAKVIRSLYREYGKAITTPEFWKVLPHNKRFTRNEIIQLWHYWVSRYYESKRWTP